MKIRIKGNSLRYRLTKNDVSRFAAIGYIEEQTCFAGKKLIYALQQNTGDKLSASFTDNKITLFMPKSMSEDWELTDKVGFEGNDNELYLLAEKDFTCLDNIAEDQSDNYPNPLSMV